MTRLQYSILLLGATLLTLSGLFVPRTYQRASEQVERDWAFIGSDLRWKTVGDESSRAKYPATVDGSRQLACSSIICGVTGIGVGAAGVARRRGNGA